MPTEVYLVKVGMNMTEGVVEEWYIPDGGTVTKGELLYRLETEKVNLDVDAEASGTVRHLIAEGITKEPGDIVGYIYAPGEAIPESLTGATAPATSPPPSAAVTEAQTELALTPRTARTATVTPEGRIKASPLARRLAAERNLDLGSLRGTGPDGRIVEADVLTADVTTTETEAASAPTGDDGSQRSSPMARKLARELGISLEGVNGTGPGGRITKEDVEALVDQHQQSATRGEDEIIPLRGMRRTIAERMHSSLRNTAQLTMDMDVRMDDAVKLRAQLIVEWAEKDIRPTYTDLVIRAAAKALTRHRHMNAELTEDALVLKQTVNVGMAVAVPDGLIVPVIAGADQMSLEEIARRSTRLSSLARDGGLTPDDLQGGTFTVTALGMYGVDAFTPIINAPQAGILGVNRIRDDTAWEDGVPRQTKVMRLSLTWDHRVLDGAPAAEFLAEVRDLLEAPYRLLI
jgi:pyruvate dehydrogenase E2 component (dihydrolipoamide acetyltransferase)